MFSRISMRGKDGPPYRGRTRLWLDATVAGRLPPAKALPGDWWKLFVAAQALSTKLW